jgi:hypothetical protein
MSILEGDIAIASPADLIAVLREVRTNLAQGRLRQIDNPNPLIARSRLSDIPDEGPWPDYLEAVLEDDQGHRYRLTVETYHGTGGSWSRM